MPSPGRLARTGLGLGLLALAGVFLHDRFFSLETSNAVLEGAPVVLRAPLAGLLEAPPGAAPQVGDILPAGAVLARLRDPRLDDSHAASLAAQVATAGAELAALDHRAARLATDLAEADRHAALFRQTRSATLRARLAEADSTVLAATARLHEAGRVLRRSRSLFASGVQPHVAVDQAMRGAEVASAERQAAVERRAVLVAELAAAEQGVFASDAGTDRSATQQLQDRLRATQAELEAQQVERTARLAALRTHLREERERLARLRATVLTLPATARLLRLAARPGEHVQPGQEVALLADCTQPEVTATVAPHVFRALRSGQAARFTPAEGGAAATGTVAALRADPVHAEGGVPRFEVTVRLAPDATRVAACGSGRLGRLSF
ncbi:HlyD family efflux transporter periplasmic adaptor subunit [Roseicella aquatilis]|uniref:HlyD family efflux transporter periplasmic adaptor subunit n=1 Tax=Roseicella aquatilis TaxID=2527868 RepID=A0A4R4DA25_9PROT|nr:HlyD family efflux transporter periplasmic adaptor subunit [Roseicella aquatilis]TCZ56691.1 HlyD family efflux transporter periplasmic adaptor subunit [Roseicella aquatilis]